MHNEVQISHICICICQRRTARSLSSQSWFAERNSVRNAPMNRSLLLAVKKNSEISQVKSPIKLSPQNGEPLLNSSRLNHTTKSHNPIQKPKQILSQPIQLEYQPHKGGKNIIPEMFFKENALRFSKASLKAHLENRIADSAWAKSILNMGTNPQGKTKEGNPSRKWWMRFFLKILSVFQHNELPIFFICSSNPSQKNCGQPVAFKSKREPVGKSPNFFYSRQVQRSVIKCFWDTYGKYRHKPCHKNTEFSVNKYCWWFRTAAWKPVEVGSWSTINLPGF